MSNGVHEHGRRDVPFIRSTLLSFYHMVKEEKPNWPQRRLIKIAGWSEESWGGRESILKRKPAGRSNLGDNTHTTAVTVANHAGARFDNARKSKKGHGWVKRGL